MGAAYNIFQKMDSQQQQQLITLDKLHAHINSVDDLYNAAIRNGYYLPSKSSSLVREEYLMEVISGQVYCPLFKDIRLQPCPMPPSKDILLTSLQEVLKQQHKDAGIDDKHTPNKQWIVHVLSTLQPKNQIFDKNYVPPKVKKAVSEVAKIVQLPSNFIKDLPISKYKGSKRLQLTRDGKLERKVLRLKEIRVQLEKDIAKLNRARDADDDDL